MTIVLDMVLKRMLNATKFAASIIAILMISFATGCVSDLADVNPLKATVENEITDPNLIQQAKQQAQMSREQYEQQSSQQLGASQGEPTISGQQNQFQSAPTQTQVLPNPMAQPTQPTQLEPSVQHINISGLPTLSGVRVTGTIAAGADVTKALIKRENEDSIICKVGDSILLEADVYVIKTITSSGAVVVESKDSTQFVIQ